MLSFLINFTQIPPKIASKAPNFTQKGSKLHAKELFYPQNGHIWSNLGHIPAIFLILSNSQIPANW